MKTLTPQSFLGFAVVLLLLSPVVVLFASGVTPSGTTSPLVAEVFAFTFLQAFLSAAVALVLGILGAYGLEAAATRWGSANGRFLEALSLLPNVAPVLIFLLAIMKFAPWLRGLTGIIAVHAMLNTGLVSVSVLRLSRAKIAGLADLAWIEGSGRVRFFFKVVLPLLASDLRMIFAFVFAICFSSLAVPLMLSGSSATTLEVLIWQVLRIDGDLSRAFGLSILQFASILALTFLLKNRTRSSNAVSARTPQPLLSTFWGLPFTVLPSLLLIASMFDGPRKGAIELFGSPLGNFNLISCVVGSFAVAIGTGCVVAFVLLLIAYVEPRGWLRRFLVGYVAPSSVITGFAILIAWREIGPATYVKIILALALIMVPSFYRLYWDATLESLNQQRVVAMSLGASGWLAFRRIVLPQVTRPVFFIAGLASLWSWGDFALSRVIAERDVTLGMTVQSLMGAYRFDIATFLVWVLLLGGAMTFFMFEGVGRVLGQKSSR